MRLERNKPPKKIVVQIIIALVICSQALALFGDVLLGGIVDKYPALLIALNPRNRNLIFVQGSDIQLDSMTYYIVGFLRLVASDPLYYLLGFWYGEKALSWVEKKSKTYGSWAREGESFFRKASYPLIFIAPNNIICALSAATGVKLKTFIALNISGTIVRLILIQKFGSIFGNQIQWLIDIITEYRIPVIIISAILVAITLYTEFRKEDSDINMLKGIEKESSDQDSSSS